MPPARSLKMTVRQMLPSAVGFTHASSVIAVVRCSEAESGIETTSPAPSKESAFPNFPAGSQLAPTTIPALPLPERSATDTPPPSSNEYAATKPAGAGLQAAVVVERVVLGELFPAASKASTEI